MRLGFNELLALAGLTIAFATVLIAMLHFLDSRRTRYDAREHKIELGELRQSIESQMHVLTNRLLAAEDRWRDVNHLLLSSQSRQEDTVPTNQELPFTSFVRASGITQADLKVDRRLVFVLTPFHEDSAATFQTIVSVCNELGLRAVRGDEEFVSGDVFPHILRLLISARIIIANVEERNPNVLYELGLAHGLGKTTILIAKSPQDTPFDIRAKKLILYRSESDLKERLRLELARSLATEEARPPADSPGGGRDPYTVYVNHADREQIGLTISILNRRKVNLMNFRIMANDARSVDRERSGPREPFGFSRVLVKAQKVLLDDEITDPAWLVRIVGDHLEVGNTVGTGILKWPSGDTSDAQMWVLKMSAESENMPPWDFEVHITWQRPSNTLHVEV